MSFIQHTQFLDLEVQGIHSWRQSQTMWNIRNFVRHDNNICNPRINKFNGGKSNILRYEFPLMQWTIAQVQKAINEEIRVVRIMMFLMGLLTLFSFMLIVKELFDDWLTAVLSAVLLQYSPVFYYYTWNPLPDSWALSFGFLYLAFVFIHCKSQKTQHLLIASIALTAATLCKLPYLMFSIVSIFFFLSDLYQGRDLLGKLRTYALPQFVILLPAIAWYIWVMPGWKGNPILTGQLGDAFDLSEYINILRFHRTTMFPRILTSPPIWILVIIGLVTYVKRWRRKPWVLSLVGITLLYLILEFKPIGVVHDYYMLPFLSWIFIIVAYGVSYLRKWKYGYLIVLAVCIWSSLYTASTMQSFWDYEKSGINNDIFLYSEELKDAVPNDEHCIVLRDKTDHLFSYRIDKMGYTFRYDHLPIGWIDDMVRNYDVRYMYSDSREVDESADFQKYLKRVMLQKGSIKVIELQLPVSIIDK